MTAYKQPLKWGLISTIIALLPLPVIGLILYVYFLIQKNITFYIFLPFMFIISIAVYIMILIGLSVIVYRMHPPLKEGTFSIHSKEMESWMAAQLVLKTINIIQMFQIPPNLMKGLYHKIFKTELGDVLVIGGEIEHSLVNIGDHVIIGQNSIMVGHMIEGDKIYIKKTKIGSHCTIGAQTVIMPGVEVGEGTIVGACSLVPKNKTLEPYSLYLGVPARKVKDLPKEKCEIDKNSKKH